MNCRDNCGHVTTITNVGTLGNVNIIYYLVHNNKCYSSALFIAVDWLNSCTTCTNCIRSTRFWRRYYCSTSMSILVVLRASDNCGNKFKKPEFDYLWNVIEIFIETIGHRRLAHTHTIHWSNPDRINKETQAPTTCYPSKTGGDSKILIRNI